MKNGILGAMMAAALAAGAAEFEPFRAGEVTVGGEIGRRMEITAVKLMDKIDVEKVFFKGFRERKEVPDMWGGFSGWGMALDAIVKAATHGIGGDRFRAFKEHWVAETISTQAADGSISMFKNKIGMWDNHEQAYLLQAFCLDHRHFGNKAALEAAKRLGDYLIARKSGVNLGLETGFVMLYRETGDIRYADYCRDAFAIEKGNDAYDRVLPVNGVTHVYTWIQRALAQLQYAEATGRDTPQMHEAADELFRRAFGDASSVSGSMSGGPKWGEIWNTTQVGLGKWGETCVSAYLLRCTAEWMRHHPEAVYGDLYERVLYNAFFGAQSHDGSHERYFIPFDECGEWYERETYCCPNNLRRMMFELPDAVFFRTADGFAVNLFAPARLKTDGLAVETETAYPREGAVSVKVKSAKAGVMRLRVPRWTGLPDAGTWRTFRYAAGESAFKVDFPMAVRLVKGRQAQTGKVAVMRGPVVYALEKSKGWGGEIDTYAIDCDRPFVWNGTGIALTVLRNQLKCPREEKVFVPFASDDRERTYFPVVGDCRAVDDELYAH